MKKLLFLFNLLLGLSAYSQNYYTGEIARGSDVVYKCLSWDPPGYIIIANDQAYSRLNARALYKDGTPVVPDSYKRAWPIDTDNSVLTSIVTNVLPIDKVKELKNSNKTLLIFVVVEPDGSIAEVGFIMSKDSPLASIPVDSYYEMEKQIKSKIRFILDDRTKNSYLWIHEVLWLDFKDIK